MRDWSMFMQWHDLLFIHWPVRPDVLRPLLPHGLKLDLYDGEGWIGVVPFQMTQVRHRVLPPLPGLSAFEELNVRTYVTCKGRPGVWFFSLDAANKIAVRTARWIFNLPYFDARMSCRRQGKGIRYRSTRTHTGAAPASFAADYRPTGPVCRSSKGSVDSFLTDRLCLYNTDVMGNLRRGRYLPSPLAPSAGRGSDSTEHHARADRHESARNGASPSLCAKAGCAGGNAAGGLKWRGFVKQSPVTWFF